MHMTACSRYIAIYIYIYIYILYYPERQRDNKYSNIITKLADIRNNTEFK